ncbi:mannitol dehydrogenase family protein [Mangrovimicrobium sediminis]|uniref:Mannitol dehydrogenase family protein n=1 Tax=Mangrovimicrobium sediminis TaxID=2562682 RepID=A0A4Z0LX72_9GAMM|nr:mannitol dehydrogenase family protein [Haliea sp. SAOS-164]TGD71737.1 mannitol dehydrogenase family protein [Haliea sp. SAOS-164]
MTGRLCTQALARLPAAVARPQYALEQLRPGIVHLGVGAFHRAHQAWYTEQALNREGGGDWGIIGASLRRPEVRDQLQPQDGLYTVVEREGGQSRYRVVGAIREVLVAPEDPAALVAVLARPEIRVITLTITEKGYHYDRASGGLDLAHPDVQHELAHFPQGPLTAVGYLVAALAQRAQAGAPGVTVLSCDNLPHNGRVLRKVVADFAARAAPQLAGWFAANTRFPCSMVDRIVPASTAGDLEDLQRVLGVHDAAAVFTEPFAQWVVEDDFVRGAPDWRAVGAVYTNDVTPFETMKLRLLNGSHSLIAYLGYLAGHEHVHEVMADAQFARLVWRFMDDEAQPTLSVPEGFDLEDYKTQLAQRFANPALMHRTYQIAQDGSQKIPQRWLASVRDLADQGHPTPILALAVAGWIRYLQGRRDDGHPFEVDDPLREQLQAAITGSDHPCRAAMAVSAVFGDLPRRQPDFLHAVEQNYNRIVSQGVPAAIKTALES